MTLCLFVGSHDAVSLPWPASTSQRPKVIGMHSLLLFWAPFPLLIQSYLTGYLSAVLHDPIRRYRNFGRDNVLLFWGPRSSHLAHDVHVRLCCATTPTNVSVLSRPASLLFCMRTITTSTLLPLFGHAGSKPSRPRTQGQVHCTLMQCGDLPAQPPHKLGSQALYYFISRPAACHPVKWRVSHD